MNTPEALNELTVKGYIKQTPVFKQIFKEQDDWTIQPITEGNVNLLIRISSKSNPIEESVIVKQALPYAWRYPDFKMPVDRSRIEVELLRIEGRYCPDQVPRIYNYDKTRHILIMEDLNQHLVMREGLMKQIRYPLVAKHIGVFMARTLFYTSDLYLSSGDKKAMVTQFINP
ncbi:MAG: S-methyl-5-thioribose kinase, partial [Candidatus Kryptoniota bacterium]